MAPLGRSLSPRPCKRQHRNSGSRSGGKLGRTAPAVSKSALAFQVLVPAPCAPAPCAPAISLISPRRLISGLVQPLGLVLAVRMVRSFDVCWCTSSDLARNPECLITRKVATEIDTHDDYDSMKVGSPSRRVSIHGPAKSPRTFTPATSTHACSASEHVRILGGRTAKTTV